jgi:glycosyltransferase involved in cell wall biosynthesis
VLASPEFEISVWSQRDAGSGADRGLPGVISVWRPGIWAGLDLFRQLRRTHPDLLHVQFEFGIYGGAPGLVSVLGALLLARLILRQHTVVTIHQVPSAPGLTAAWLRRSGVRLPAWAGRRVVRVTFALLGRSADRLIVHADVFGRRLHAEWGVRPPVTVVPHGVARRGDPRHHDEPRLLLFGYLKWYKGIEIAIDAFRRLAAAFPDWTLTIAGPPSSEAYLETLRILARPLGRRVEFLGSIDEDRVDELFRRAGIVLFPYRTVFSASGPLALAIGHEIPFVVSEEMRSLCPDWPHWAPPDPDLWANVLRPLMRDDAVRAAARRLAAALAQERTWPAVAAATRGVYKAVVC